jgi:hypothetical protein
MLYKRRLEISAKRGRFFITFTYEAIAASLASRSLYAESLLSILHTIDTRFMMLAACSIKS